MHWAVLEEDKLVMEESMKQAQEQGYGCLRVKPCFVLTAGMEKALPEAGLGLGCDEKFRGKGQNTSGHGKMGGSRRAAHYLAPHRPAQGLCQGVHGFVREAVKPAEAGEGRAVVFCPGTSLYPGSW